MSGLEPIIAIAAIGTMVAAGVSAAGSIYGGQQKQEANYAAGMQEEAQGRAEFAASQQESFERRLEGQLIMSRQQAAAAASGGGAGSDAPTIVKLLTETGERAQLGEASVRYGGEIRRDALYNSASARRKTGDSSFLGGILDGIGTLAGGVGNALAATA